MDDQAGPGRLRHRVLVVDDEPSLRYLIVEVLREEGFEVAEAEHGQAALACLAGGFEPDVVVLDLSMPVMDGAALQRRLHADGHPALVLAVTGQQRDRADTGIPFADFLAKPFDLDDLIGRVSGLAQRCEESHPASA